MGSAPAKGFTQTKDPSAALCFLPSVWGQHLRKWFAQKPHNALKGRQKPHNAIEGQGRNPSAALCFLPARWGQHLGTMTLPLRCAFYQPDGVSRLAAQKTPCFPLWHRKR